MPRFNDWGAQMNQTRVPKLLQMRQPRRPAVQPPRLPPELPPEYIDPVMMPGATAAVDPFSGGIPALMGGPGGGATVQPSPIAQMSYEALMRSAGMPVIAPKPQTEVTMMTQEGGGPAAPPPRIPTLPPTLSPGVFGVPTTTPGRGGGLGGLVSDAWNAVPNAVDRIYPATRPSQFSPLATNYPYDTGSGGGRPRSGSGPTRNASASAGYVPPRARDTSVMDRVSHFSASPDIQDFNHGMGQANRMTVPDAGVNLFGADTQSSPFIDEVGMLVRRRPVARTPRLLMMGGGG